MQDDPKGQQATTATGPLHHVATVAVELIVNAVLPFAIYMLLDDRLGDVKALLWSMAPPILWNIVTLIRKRRLDIFSVFVLVGIALSVLLALGTHSARMLQLRENLVTLLIGLVFLGSVAIGKPLVYQLALAGQRRKGNDAAESFTKLNQRAGFRRSMVVMTLVWGFSNVGVFAANVAMVYMMPIPTYLLVSPFVSYGMIGCVILWTVWYVRRAQRRGAAYQAKAGSA